MKYIILIFQCILVFDVLGGCHNSVNTYEGLIEYDEDWGYVNVREGAHTFWWLYSVNSSSDRPWILWLQGGPGASGAGYGNFMETGPKTINGSDNPGTWLQVADMVYVDNPVGTGFSYVNNSSLLATNVEEIGQDLLKWLQAFLLVHDEYRSRPFYIFCESYGGKMGAEFARVINEGFLDDVTFTKLSSHVNGCLKLLENSSWDKFTLCYIDISNFINMETGRVSTYNILKKRKQDAWSKKSTKNQPLEHLFLKQFVDELNEEKYMNTVVRQKLGIIPDHVIYEAVNWAVYYAQSVEFYKANWETVDILLKKGTNVIVYNGSLDLICNVLGTNYWMQRLTWDKMDQFHQTKITVFETNSTKLAGYYKVHENLQYWTILGAGHMVPYDKPESAVFMLNEIFKNTQ